MPISDHIGDIAADLHDAQMWEQRQADIRKQAAYYDDPRNGNNLIRATQMYPGVPVGILDAVVREGKDLNDPSTVNLIAYAYGKEVQSGSYGIGQKVISDFAARKSRPGEINADLYESKTTSPTLVPIPNDPAAREAYTKALEGGLPNVGGIFKWDPSMFTPEEKPQMEKLWRHLQDTYFKADLPVVWQAGSGAIYEDTANAVRKYKDGSNYFTMAPDRYTMGWNINTKELQPGELDAKGKGGISNPYAPMQKFQAPAAAGITDAKSLSRFAAMAGDFSQQEITGLARAAYGAGTGKGWNPQWQSDLAVWWGDKDLDTGQGFFVDPDSELAHRRRHREAQYGQIYGHNLSVGRIAASFIPGVNGADDTPFKLVSGSVDAAKQFFDPVALAGGKGASASEAGELFAAERALASLIDDAPEEVEHSAGLYRGLRLAFDGDTYSGWSSSAKGRAVKEVLAGYNPDKPGTSARRLWQAMGEQHDPALIERLYQTRDEQQVDDVLRGVIGTQIRSKHELDKIPGHLGNEALSKLYTGSSETLRNSRLTSRFFQFLPESSIDIRSRQNVAENLMKWGKLGGVSDAQLDKTFAQVATARNKEDYFRSVTDLMEVEDGVLASHGIKSVASRRALTQLYKDRYNDALDSLIQSVASNQAIDDLVAVNGEHIQNLSPEVILEHVHNNIPLPDINRIRRVLRNKSYRWLTTDMDPADIGKMQWPGAALSTFQERLWKPAQLVGRAPAWVLRVVGEEQLRMVIAGLDNAYNHPISALASTIGRRSLSPELSPAGNAWDDLEALESVVLKGHGGLIRRPGASPAVPKVFDKLKALDHSDYLRSWATQIAVLHKSPESNFYLNSDVEQTVEHLFSNDGAHILQRMRSAEPELFATKETTANWLDSVLEPRVQIISNGHADILDAMQTGKFRGVAMLDRKGNLNSKFVNALDEMVDENGPRFVKGFEPMSAEYRNRADKAVDWVFGHTMSLASNKLSRSPTFKQYTWKHTAEMLPFATEEVQQQVLENAAKARVSNRLMKTLVSATKRGAEGKIDNIETLEHLASGYAADSTKRLLYDLSRRGLVSEQIKLLSPFANAYQEIFATYAKMLWGKQYGLGGKIAKTVQVGRRAQQIIEGARANGWFMKNQFGDEVFVFPFSESVNQAITGIPVPMTGRVKGLNMVGDIMPGIGPVAAVPLAAMMEGKPESVQEVVHRILPYGAPGEKDPNEIFNIQSYMPSWMQKGLLAVSAGLPPGIENLPGIKQIIPDRDQVLWDQKAWQGTQISVMQYLMSTGRYDTTTRAGMNKLMEDARTKAKDLYYVRSFMQFFSPTAPAWDWVAKDKSGRNVAVSAVTEEYYKMLDDGKDLDEATIALMDKYGDNIFSLVVPKTKSVTYSVPRTRDADIWMSKHSDIVRKFPATYGFFAPQTGDYDYTIAVKQIARGQVEALTPSEWANLRNETLKTMQYNYYKNQLGDSISKEQATWLRNIRQELEDQYPSTVAGIPQKPETDEVIHELRDAIKNPTLAKTDVGQALEQYFYYYDRANKAAINYDPNAAGFTGAKAFRPLREWMSSVAQQLIDDHPDFDNVWTSVLSKQYEPELR